MVSRSSPILSDVRRRGTRLCIIPKGWPRPCSPCDVHVVHAFSVPVPAFILRRSRSHPRLGLAVVRSHFRTNVPRRSPPRPRPSTSCEAFGRVHLLVSTAHVSRRSRATLRRLTVHGLASSCHVSTRACGDLLSVRRPRLPSHPATTSALAFRRSRPPCRTAPAFRARLSTFTPRVRRTVTRLEPARLATSVLETCHRCACVHLSLGTDFRSQPKRPRSLDTLRCLRTASSPAPRSTCISRRSRSAGTSVLTLAHVFVVSGPLVRSAFAFRRSRSEPRFAIHVHAHVQSLHETSGTFWAPTIPRCRAPRDSNTFQYQTPRGAA
jgi:hypothetical protein